MALFKLYFGAQVAGADETGAFASDGAGVATFTGQSTASGAFSSDGAATAEFVGAAVGAAVISSDGAATAQWVGDSLSEGSGAFSMDGTSTAEFVGQSSASAAFSSDGAAEGLFDATEAPAAAITPPTQAGATLGGGGPWSHYSAKRKKRLRDEDEEIMKIITQVAPDLMRHRRKVH